MVDYSRAYSELVFPLFISTYYQNDRVIIDQNIEELVDVYFETFKNTSFGECSVYVMFVLISFVAENSIKVSEFYSPIQSEKNYLSMIDNNANKAISAGIENDNDDFALLNNGITMVCSNFTWTNENGLEGVSNVQIEDSQIINGGQMAGTL